MKAARAQSSSIAHVAAQGGRAGRELNFRDVVRLALHTLPYLKSVWPELRRLLLPVVALSVLLTPLFMMAADLYLNGLMIGKPLSPFEAKVLRIDPATFVDVPVLSVAARQFLRGRLVVVSSMLFVFGTVVGLFVYNWFLRLRQRIEQSLRSKMMANVQSMSLRFHSGARVGDAIFRTYQDNAMVTNLMWMLVEPAYALVALLIASVVALVLDPLLGLGLVLGGVLAFVLTAIFTPALRRNFRQARERDSALTSHIQETMAGLKVIKAYGAEPAFQRSFEQQSRAAFDSAYRARTTMALLGIIVFSLTAFVMIGANGYLALASGEGRAITSGRALAFVGFGVWSLGAYAYAMGRLRAATLGIGRLSYLWGLSQDMAIGMGRAFEHADLKPDVEDAPSVVPMPSGFEELAFERVSFAYQPDRPVLRGVDLSVRAGTVTALVGPTGSGKSTLGALMLRLFDPDDGRIMIDGTDIRSFAIDALRSRVSIALQENILFGATIRDNIRFAVPDASDAEVEEAARIACADEFIREQPQGYDTLLGERGTKLSAGQRQRLSIARAIIKDTPVLILDEPTASLDAETELRVLRNLSQWGRGRAIFFITHRLSTIRHADQIVYLRDGSVVEVGSHEVLVEQPSGAYRRFVELEGGRDRVASRAKVLP